MKTFRNFMSEGSKEEYKKFFDAKLKKYGVKSPDELSDDEKKKFYGELDKEWNADHESGKDGVNEYIKKDGARRRCACLLYTSPSPRDRTRSRMPSSA